MLTSASASSTYALRDGCTLMVADLIVETSLFQGASRSVLEAAQRGLARVRDMQSGASTQRGRDHAVRIHSNSTR
jgi:hypothetical protein